MKLERINAMRKLIASLGTAKQSVDNAIDIGVLNDQMTIEQLIDIREYLRNTMSQIEMQIVNDAHYTKYIIEITEKTPIQSCTGCRFHSMRIEHKNDFCHLANKNINIVLPMFDKPDWCPLIEVKE